MTIGNEDIDWSSLPDYPDDDLSDLEPKFRRIQHQERFRFGLTHPGQYFSIIKAVAIDELVTTFYDIGVMIFPDTSPTNVGPVIEPGSGTLDA